MNRPLTRRPSALNQHDSAEIPPLSTLINLKKLVVQEGPDYLAVEQHFLNRLMDPLIRSVFVDEDWYLDKYPDVKTSIRSGAVQNATEHYVRFGYFEHRLPYRIEVDEQWYLNQYADVRASVSREDITSGQQHYELFGFREGRMPFRNFALRKAVTGE